MENCFLGFVRCLGTSHSHICTLCPPCMLRVVFLHAQIKPAHANATVKTKPPIPSHAQMFAVFPSVCVVEG